MKKTSEPDATPGRPDSAGAVPPQNPAAGPASKIPKSWRWHYQALVFLRARLIEARDRHLHEGADPIERYSMHPADAATDQFDQDLALSLLSVEGDALFEVEAAMKRIADGTYGVCEQTHEPIPDARSRAVPWTRFCEDVEARLESAGGKSHPHLGTLRSVRAAPAADFPESEPAVDDLEPAAPAEPPDEESTAA